MTVRYWQQISSLFLSLVAQLLKRNVFVKTCYYNACIKFIVDIRTHKHLKMASNYDLARDTNNVYFYFLP